MKSWSGLWNGMCRSAACIAMPTFPKPSPVFPQYVFPGVLMATTRVVTLDLNFQGRPHAIAVYLIRHSDGAVLHRKRTRLDSSRPRGGSGKEGLSPRDVTHVLLTHIHLDHAGAAGWLARQGAEMYVHRVGAPHMLSPERLIASATRIYGDRMESLWGEFLPVPESQLSSRRMRRR
jgi:hypothetical protein